MPDWRDLTARLDIAIRDVAQWANLPVVPTWSRLEPLTLTRGDLAPGAQALIADPLWLLGRQWQFDELRGEDGGSPIKATVRGETARFDRFHAGGLGGGDEAAESIDLPSDTARGALPLEALVEAEVPAVLPLRLRTQTGLHLVRLLRSAGLDAVANAVAQQFPVATRPVATPGGGTLEDPLGDARARLARARVPDGSAVLAALDEVDDGAGGLAGVPVPLRPAAAGAEQACLDTLAAWRHWASGLLAQPAGRSWNPHRLEHSFAVQASMSDGPVLLRADEYTGGRLDWFHGDLAAGPDLRAAPGHVEPTVLSDTTLPSPVRFAGMPNDRLFAFEDSVVFLGGIEAGRTDLARLALVEFALAYSIDWFNVPLTLPYGAAARIDSVQVVDTFGVVVDVVPAREATSPGWAAFQATPVRDTSRLADVFVLASTVPRTLEGPPLEEIVLFRDEMANLVWGVERIVPGPVSGEPIQRARQASRVSLRQTIPGDLHDAKIIYRLMTPVPENWMPFVAVRDSPADLSSHHVLERRPMLRYRPDGTSELINPLGTVLLTSDDADPATDRLRIAEEEVPRDGVAVTRTFSLARTPNGGTVLWIARRVRTGEGEGSSGLRFDTALPPAGL